MAINFAFDSCAVYFFFSFSFVLKRQRLRNVVRKYLLVSLVFTFNFVRLLAIRSTELGRTHKRHHKMNLSSSTIVVAIAFPIGFHLVFNGRQRPGRQRFHRSLERVYAKWAVETNSSANIDRAHTFETGPFIWMNAFCAQPQFRI